MAVANFSAIMFRKKRGNLVYFVNPIMFFWNKVLENRSGVEIKGGKFGNKQ